MAQNVFQDKIPKPTSARLAKALGARSKYFDELKRHIPGQFTEEWKYYGKTLGWGLKVLLENRNLFFLGARKGYFSLGFILGDKAVAAAQKSTLSPDLKQQLLEAKKYAEGRGVRFDVKSRHALEQAKILIDIKLGSSLQGPKR